MSIKFLSVQKITTRTIIHVHVDLVTLQIYSVDTNWSEI